jgi:multidrug resistance efflux pump
VAAARAEFASAQADLERFESLLRAKAGSQKQRDDAATRSSIARERVQAAESRVLAADQAAARLRAGARRRRKSRLPMRAWPPRPRRWRRLNRR